MFVCTGAKALDAFYLGGQFGYSKLSGDYSNGISDAIGFGADLGVRTNGIMDVMASFMTSSHSGVQDLTTYRQTLSAEVHLAAPYDFDITVGAGPGIYIFKPGVGNSTTKFGANLGAAVDVVIDEHLRVGMGYRFHGIFGSDANAGSLWQVTMRVGYLFTL